ncbi:MAG: hypothetical protein IJE43_02040 [Alphaproteobacteria bacterium]|nr:hypothetical protein [Alphaproteobacteria bacterium]
MVQEDIINRISDVNCKDAYTEEFYQGLKDLVDEYNVDGVATLSNRTPAAITTLLNRLRNKFDVLPLNTTETLLIEKIKVSSSGTRYTDEERMMFLGICDRLGAQKVAELCETNDSTVLNRISRYRKYAKEFAGLKQTEEEAIVVTGRKVTARIELPGANIICYDGATRANLLVAQTILSGYSGEALDCKVGKDDEIVITLNKGLNQDTIRTVGNLLGYMTI